MRENTTKPIAVVGIGCRYPGATSARELWENILARRQAFRRLPDCRLPLAEYHDPDPTAPDKTYATRAAVLDGFSFDWAKRRIPKSTFETTDIVHWLALEVALAAIDDAGMLPESLPRDRTGVLIGNTLTGEQARSAQMRLRWPYVAKVVSHAGRQLGVEESALGNLLSASEDVFKSVFTEVDEDTLAGSLSNTIPGRICNFLDLHGGGYTVDGACASSLLAIIAAADALNRGDLDLALAGGVDVSIDAFELIGFAKTGALTPDVMRVFDRRANGFLSGEGCGIVVLKRLADAERDGDRVYATLRGWGVSSDGAGGITAPSSRGQSLALERAYRKAGYSPGALHFVEGHGTGTPVGDKAELEGIQLTMDRFRAAEGQDGTGRSCGVTSFKSIFGHTKAAAGVGGLIKAVMAVNRRVVPPTAGCVEPAPTFADKAGSLYPVLRAQTHGPTEVLRAGVSAMGFGGINSHVTLQSAAAPDARLDTNLTEAQLGASAQDSELFPIAAPNQAELLVALAGLKQRALGASVAELMDLSAECIANLVEGPVRAAFVADTAEQLTGDIDALQTRLEEASERRQDQGSGLGDGWASPDRRCWFGGSQTQTVPPRIAFVYPGQGSQQLSSARILVDRYAWARDLVADADRWLQEVGEAPVSELLFRSPEQARDNDELQSWKQTLREMAITEPVVMTICMLWTRYLKRELGIAPQVVAGHSLGELAALCAAGAYDEESLIKLAALRGRAERDERRDGAMAGLGCGRAEAIALLEQVDGYVVIANHNSPKQTVISGEPSAVDQALKLARKARVAGKRLPVSGAFHSKFLEPAAEIVRSQVRLPSDAPTLRIPVVSSVEGKGVLDPPLALRDHVAEQMYAPVDFVSVTRALRERADLILEVGPSRILSGLIEDTLSWDARSQGAAKPAGAFPTALPIEARVGRDWERNQLVAALFVRGAPVRLAALVQGRLTRPFAPASERSFIENPCERPLQPRPQAESREPDARLSPGLAVRPAKGGSTEAWLAAHAGLSDAEFARYRHVRADLVAATKGSIEAAVKLVALDARAQGIGAASPPANTAVDSAVRGTTAAAERSAVQTTTAAQATSAAPEVAPVAASGDNGLLLPPSMPSALDVLRQAIATRAGYPLETVLAEHRVLDDLHLDSIKAAELVRDVTHELGITADLDPAHFANATLSEVALALDAASDEGSAAELASALSPTRVPVLEPQRGPAPPNGTVSTAEIGQPWVRQFKHCWVPAAIAQSSDALERWRGARVAVVVLSPTLLDWGQQLGDELSSAGATVEVSDGEPPADGPPSQQWAHDAQFTHHLLLMDPAAEAALEAVVGRLCGWVQRLGQAGVGEGAPNAEVVAIERSTSISQDGGHIRCGLQAFIASLHHERPGLKVRALSVPAAFSATQVARAASHELKQLDRYIAAKYAAANERLVSSHEPCTTASYAIRPYPIGPKSVVLVTGGARGITAECALVLGEQTGAALVLVGRSERAEVEETLARFEQHGVRVHYYVCDLAERQAVLELAERVEREVGPIDAVVHGAGVNRLRRLEHVDAREAQKEIGAKLSGAIHLFEALDNRPPKLFFALTSLIGVTGMPGNGWYAFSNEALARSLENFGERHPGTETLSLAFSVWDEVGMGVRTGSLERLRESGVAPIPVRAGVEQFVELVRHRPPASEIIVTSRLGELDTWRSTEQVALDVERNFIEEIVAFEPGVELVAKASLSLESDAFLGDHCFRGSFLLPAAFGLEAMAQAVATTTGRRTLGPLRIENVRFDKPIVVPESGSKDVFIYAQADQPSRDAWTVRAGIRGTRRGDDADIFSATFMLDPEETPLREAIALPPFNLEAPVPVAERPIYGAVLFHGPKFQRLEEILSLDQHHGVFRIQGGKSRWVLGDPFVRDAVFQSCQLCVSPDICLPHSIEKMEFRADQAEKEGGQMSFVKHIEKEAGGYRADLSVTNDERQLIERITTFRGHTVRQEPLLPVAEEIALGTTPQQATIVEHLGSRANGFGLALPKLQLIALEGLSQESVDRRHRREAPLLGSVAASALPASTARERAVEAIEIRWTAEGKPYLPAYPVAISLSQDAFHCLCVAGPGSQGCDLLAITPRSEKDWEGLFPRVLHGVLDRLRERYSTDAAGSLLWAARETVLKAHERISDRPRPAALSLELVKAEHQAAVFRCSELEVEKRILACCLDLQGQDYVVALTCTAKPSDVVAEPATGRSQPAVSARSAANFGPPTFEVLYAGGRQGQDVFIHRFPLTAADSANPSQTVRFPSYAAWAGKVRELAGNDDRSYHRQLYEMLGSGQLTSVTSKFELEVLGYPGIDDWIEVHFSLEGVSDSHCSLVWDWWRCAAPSDERRQESELVARSRMKTAAVQMVGPGLAETARWPDFFLEYLKTSGPRHFSAAKHDEEAKAPPVSQIIHRDRSPFGDLVFRKEDGPEPGPLLHQETFQTSLMHSNLVGNIYFSHYLDWQAHTRDRYLWQVSSHTGTNDRSRGEVRCSQVWVEHVREAMPFDTVLVSMHLTELSTRGATLAFQYHRVDPGGTLVALARSEQRAFWAEKRDGAVHHPTDWPSVLFDELLRADRFRQKGSINAATTA